MATRRNIAVLRGDSKLFIVTVYRNGVAQDPTGKDFRLTAKWKLTDADSSAVFRLTTAAGDIAIYDAPAGKILVTIAPSATLSLPAHRVDLYYDVQMVPSGSGSVYTVLIGRLIVVPDVSITTP